MSIDALLSEVLTKQINRFKSLLQQECACLQDGRVLVGADDESQMYLLFSYFAQSHA